VFSDREHGRYVVWDSKHIALFILLFNGNLVLPKRIDQLKVWLAVYNSKKGNIPFISSQDAVKLSLNSAWFELDLVAKLGRLACLHRQLTKGKGALMSI